MSELKNTDPIPAADVSESRPWRLPFWTEPPTHNAKPKNNKKGSAQVGARVDELELIRREAYNDGLEQGLVEGRQQGQLEGKEEGRKQGHDQGYREGKGAGRKAGYEEGLNQGKTEIEAKLEQLTRVAQTLMGAITQRDQELPEVTSHLCQQVCEQILRHELESGAKAIDQYVEAAIDALPAGEEALNIYVSQEDLAVFQQSENAKDLIDLCRVDTSLKSGECRVNSEHSLVEYSTDDNFKQTIKVLGEKILKAPAVELNEESFKEVPPNQAQEQPKPEQEQTEASSETADAYVSTETTTEQDHDS